MYSSFCGRSNFNGTIADRESFKSDEDEQDIEEEKKESSENATLFYSEIDEVEGFNRTVGAASSISSDISRVPKTQATVAKDMEDAVSDSTRSYKRHWRNK